MMFWSGSRNRKKKLHLIPLILGGYGAFLGLGLAAIGLFEIKEGIGIARFVFGLCMTGFGLLGIWDGVRDLVKPDQKPEKTPVSQFILTDTSGNKSSNVTLEFLQKQIDTLPESEDYKSFHLQILPPLPVGEQGMLKQITCVYHHDLILVAFFEMTNDGYRICQKSTEPDTALEWLKRLLEGSPDFSGWKDIETDDPQDEETLQQDELDIPQDELDIPQDEESVQQEQAVAQQDKANIRQGKESTQQEQTDIQQDEKCLQRTEADEEDRKRDETDNEAKNIDAFWQQLLTDQKGLMTHWHKLLVILGESWHDEHKFFSSRDLELAIEGIQSGKYQKAVLEWGYESFDIFPGQLNDLMVIWCKNNGTRKENPRFLAREGTVTQVKFWLVNYLDHGSLEETNGWSDITAQVEKEGKKGEKKHGKVF